MESPEPPLLEILTLCLRPPSAFSRVLIPMWWSRGRQLRNTKPLRVLTSKVKHLFLELSEETNRGTFRNSNRGVVLLFHLFLSMLETIHYTFFVFKSDEEETHALRGLADG